MPESVTYVSGLRCYLCPRSVPTDRLTLLAAAERTTDRRAERHPAVRSQQKPTLGSRYMGNRVTTFIQEH